MRVFFIILFVLSGWVFSQVNLNDGDIYDKIARYSILKYSLLSWDSAGDELIEADFDIRLNRIDRIVSEDDFKYSIVRFDRIGSYQFLAVVDSSNFQLHQLNVTFWAIKYGVSPIEFYSFDNDSIDLFINHHIVGSNDSTDKMKILKLYNDIKFYFVKSSCEFFNGKNMESFKYLSKEYRLSNPYYNVLEKQKIGNDWIYDLETFYKISEENTVSYYLIHYYFLPNKFYVENTLLYKIKA